MFEECYGDFDFASRDERERKFDSIFDSIPLSNKCKTKAKAGADKCQKNACDKYGWAKCEGYPSKIEIGCKAFWETFCCYLRSAVIIKSCSATEMQVMVLFEFYMVKSLEESLCKDWPRKNYICKVRKS